MISTQTLRGCAVRTERWVERRDYTWSDLDSKVNTSKTVIADGISSEENAERHPPVWLRMWTLSVPLLANFCPQYGHIFSFSPVCVWRRNDTADIWLTLRENIRNIHPHIPPDVTRENDDCDGPSSDTTLHL